MKVHCKDTPFFALEGNTKKKIYFLSGLLVISNSVWLICKPKVY